MSTIVVQVTDQPHTLTALHAACDMARNNQFDVVLLKLIPVTHPSWLGTEDLGYLNLTEQDLQALREYQREAEIWGATVESRCLQVVSSLDGIVWAAECLNAQIVFAQLTHSLIPFWHMWQTSLLRHRLEQRQCQLYMPNGSTPDWIPAQRALAVHN